jgi:hypothetical protein
LFSIIFAFVLFLAILLSASNFNHVLRGHFDKSGVKVPYVSDFYMDRCYQVEGGEKDNSNMMNFENNY